MFYTTRIIIFKKNGACVVFSVNRVFFGFSDGVILNHPRRFYPIAP